MSVISEVNGRDVLGIAIGFDSLFAIDILRCWGSMARREVAYSISIEGTKATMTSFDTGYQKNAGIQSHYYSYVSIL